MIEITVLFLLNLQNGLPVAVFNQQHLMQILHWIQIFFMEKYAEQNVSPF